MNETTQNAEDLGREAWLSVLDDTACHQDLRANDLYPTQSNVDAWTRGWCRVLRASIS